MEHLFFSWAVLSIWEDWFDPVALLFANLVQGSSGKTGMMRRPFPCSVCGNAHALCCQSPSQPRNSIFWSSHTAEVPLRWMCGSASKETVGLGKVSRTVMQPWQPELDCRGRREKMMITEGRAHKQQEGSVSFHSQTCVYRLVRVRILCQLPFVFFELKFNFSVTKKAVPGSS